MGRFLARLEAPELSRVIEDSSLSLRNNDELSRLKRGCMLLFSTFVLGDGLTKLARMCPIKRFRKTDLKAVIRRVFDDHPHPSRRLKNRPMAAKQLANSRETKDLAGKVLHGQQGFKQGNPEIAKEKRNDIGRASFWVLRFGCETAAKLPYREAV